MMRKPPARAMLETTLRIKHLRASARALASRAERC
jgi:hypothetical protein